MAETTLPAIPFDRRRRVFDQAAAFLKRICILVDVVDREATVRQYRISGSLYPQLAEDVIAHAVAKGFDLHAAIAGESHA